MSDITPVEAMPQQIPIGEAKSLKEHAVENWQDRLLLFSQVKNEVVKVNPDVQFPLNIEEGKPTPAGLFAERTFTKKAKPGEIPLEVLPRQLRSTLLARAIFRDNQGNLYRDIDLKGMGFFSQNSEFFLASYKPIVSRPGKEPGSGGRYGLLDKETAFYDYENGEDLSQIGVRVARTVAIIELQELIVDSEKISIGEARKRGIIDKRFQPVIQVRAFGTRARIGDLLKLGDVEDTKQRGLPELAAELEKYKAVSDLLLKDAKKIVAQELGKELITDEEYLEWFAKTLGKNAAVIHKNGWVHGALHNQNITLDCRIVDFDTVEDMTKQNYQEEMELAKKALTTLFNKVMNSDVSLHALTSNRSRDSLTNPIPPALTHLENLFQQSYDSTFPMRMRKYKSLKQAG